RRFLDLVAQVDAESVERAPSRHLHAEVRHVGESPSVVRLGEQRLREIAADLLLVDVERAGDLDIRDVIAVDRGVHQSRNRLVRAGIAIVRQALNERGGTIPCADDADAHSIRAQNKSPSAQCTSIHARSMQTYKRCAAIDSEYLACANQ